MRIITRIILVAAGLVLTFIILFAFSLRDRRPRIYFAVENGDTNAIAKYLASGSNVNATILSYPFGGNRNVPLLDIAVENGQLDTVGFLLKHGANPNQPDYSSETPLMWAIGRSGNDVPVERQMKVLKLLIASGADPNQRASNQWGITPLMWAAEFGELEMAKTLLAAGADVNETNNIGATALHGAKNAEIARILIHAGADRNARMTFVDQGVIHVVTPVDSAREDRRFDVLAVLTNAPAKQP